MHKLFNGSVKLISASFKYKRECIKISVIYFIIGVFWIYFSDRIAYILAQNESVLLMLNTYKGWFYVIVTSLILYILLSGLLRKVEQSEKDNLYLSYYDVLTGLYNRRFYEMEVERLDDEKNLPISVVMADVNGLKMINDAFGHQLGDEFLRNAAQSIKKICRENDIVARWGGDEFVILLPKTTYEETETIVNQIRETCCGKVINMVAMSMALGWATKDSMNVSFDEILKNAEDDMYKYKLIQNAGLGGSIINTIIKTLYEKNPREEEHSERVGEVAEKIGLALGFSELEASKLRVIGHLHDIGKIGIEEGILNKAGRLTEREQEEVHRHPDVGYRILSASGGMSEFADCVLAHHERWDGNGYPRGILGGEIPLEARIIALADSYDAMSSERPYRKPIGEEAIILEIKRNSGCQFDPTIAHVFVEKVLGKPWD